MLSSKYIWLATSAAVKIVYGVLLYKTVSTVFGLASLGMIGQLLSMLSISMVLSNGGIGRGIIQSYSNFSSSNEKSALADTLSATRTINSIASIAVLIVVLCFSSSIANGMLGDEKYVIVVVVLAFSQIAMGINTSITSLLIARDQSISANKASVSAYLVLIALLLLAAFHYKDLEMLLVLLALQPIVLLCMLYAYAHRTTSSFFRFRFAKLNSEMVSYLLRFSLAIILPVLFIQSNQILSRILIKSNLSATDLGYWESIVKIDEGILQLIALPLIYFFLPAASKVAADHKKLVRQYLLVIVLVYFCGFVVFTLFGESILIALYNSEAAVMHRELVILMVAGIAKSYFVINQYVLLSKNSVFTFIFMELIFYSMLVSSVWLAMQKADLSLVFEAYACVALMISMISFLVVRNKETARVNVSL